MATSPAVTDIEVTTKDHQKFNQFLRYHREKQTGKGADVQQLASLFKGCKDESCKNTTSGYLTPGNIATLLNVQQQFYPTVAMFQEVLQKEIAKNQELHPPAGDAVMEGADFWCSKFHFKHVGAEVSTDHCSTKQNISKHTNVQLGNTSAAAALTASAAMSLLDVEQKSKADEEVADAKAKKLEARKEAQLGKRCKLAGRNFMQLVNLLAKCSIVDNLGEPYTSTLAKVEKEVQALQVKDGDDLKVIEQKLAKMSEAVSTLHAGFPAHGPKAKKARTAEAAEPGAAIDAEAAAAAAAAERAEAAAGATAAGATAAGATVPMESDDDDDVVLEAK